MRFVLPIVVLLAGFGAAALLIVSGPDIQARASETVPPLVRVVVAEPGTEQFSVRTHGTVLPRTESELVPEVDGRVIDMSPSLVSGGFFAEGDVLLRIDPLDYDFAVQQARAGLARAESDLDNAERNLKRQQDLLKRRAVSDAERDDAQNRVAIGRATLHEAKARLARALRDRERTSVVAPYDGRVRSERVDVGQFVRRGNPIGMIYAVDYAEVRLPIHDQELAFLNLPLNQASANTTAPVQVTLSAEFAGETHQWHGEVVRTEGELDPNTRMVHVIARIPDPYSADNGAPLAVGLFVDATLHGHDANNVTTIPRTALHGDGRVMVVDGADQLRFRDVDVLRVVDETVFIGAGVSAGERICISALQNTRDGMAVRVLNESPTALTGVGAPGAATGS